MESLTENPGGEALLDSARRVARRLIDAGHEAWLVGGYVRDKLLALKPKEIDIATSARPNQVEKLFPGSRFVGRHFGVSLVKDGDYAFEVATFRADGAYRNHRHPESVRFSTMEDDALRRDFTINALYMDPFTGEVRDLVGGVADLHRKALCAIGNPATRFNEDALRLLRAIRFAVRFDFAIEPETWKAIAALSPTIRFISPERHRDELTRILTGPRPGTALRLLRESGLLAELLPEVAALSGVEQGREFHPEGDVFVHTCLVLDNLEPRNVVTAWGALLHDIGKPATFKRSPEGRISFHEHQFVGANIARPILERLKFSNDDMEAIIAVIERHMTFMNIQQMRQGTLRRFLESPTIEHDLAVHRADCLGSNGRLDYWEFARQKLADWEAEKAIAPTRPLVTGDDLKELGLKPGPEIGRLLRRVQELQWEGELRTNEEALNWIKSEMSRADE